MFGDDPFGDSPFGDSPFKSMRPRAEYRRPLPAEQSEGMMRSLTNRGLSGLSYVASVLDKPGRAVRGVLAGKPREALNVLPFSDTLGITDPEQQVSGRDLLHQSGLVDKRSKGWVPWGAGVAAEVALDPTTYMTFGAKHALTPVGKVLQNTGHLKGASRVRMLRGFSATESGLLAAGKTPEEVAHMMRANPMSVATKAAEQAAQSAGHTITPGSPLGGLLGIGLPFGQPKILGTGPRAQAVARSLDAAGSKLAYGNALGRQIGAWFDPDKNDAITALSQRAWKEAGSPARDALRAEARGVDAGARTGIDKILRTTGADEPELVRALDMARESQPLVGVPAHLQGPVQALGKDFIQTLQRQIAERRARGLRTKDLEDAFTGYAAREGMSVPKSGIQARPDGAMFATGSGSGLARKKLFRDIPGGKAALDDWASRFSGNTDIPGTAQQILGEMWDHAMRGGHLPKMTPEMQETLSKKAEALAKKFAKRGEDMAGVPLFSPNIPHTMKLVSERHANQVGSVEALKHALTMVATTSGGPDTVSLRRALKSINDAAGLSGGVKHYAGDEATGKKAEGIIVEMLRSLAQKGQGPIDQILTNDKALKKEADNWHIPLSAVEELKANYRKWVDPTNAAPTMRAVDSINSAFKNLTYSIWLPSHLRNLVSANWSNFTEGVGRPGLAYRVMRDTAKADEVRKLFPQFAGLTDDEARQAVRDLAYKHANIFGGRNAETDIPGTGAELIDNWKSGESVIPSPVGQGRTGNTGSLAGDFAGLIKEGIVGNNSGASPRDFFGQAGLGGGLIDMWREFRGKPSVSQARTKDTWAPLVAGRKLGTNIEDFSRLSGFLGGIGKGMSPEQAGELMNRIHFDYGKVTDFERRFMKRLVPFYTFQSRNLPLQVSKLVTEPRKIMGQLRPLSESKGDYAPSWLSSGVAIPQGSDKNGTQRYISQLGLPVEEAFQRLKFDGGLPDIGGTAMAYLAGVNPILRAPAEQLFDRQFFSGRRLSDLRPTTVGSLGGALGDENAGLLTQAISATPASRAVTSLDRLMDSRKGLLPKALNLLTGVRVTDVDKEKSQAIEARNALEELLRRSPHLSSYTNFFVKPEEQHQLTPAESSLLRMFTEMQAKAKAYAKKTRNAG